MSEFSGGFGRLIFVLLRDEAIWAEVVGGNARQISRGGKRLALGESGGYSAHGR